MAPNDDSMLDEHARFVTTRWSVVLGAAAPPEENTDHALETLCRTYWPAVYAYLLRHGQAREDARDLTQAFFARLPLQRRATPPHEESLWGALCVACLVLALGGVILVESPLPLLLLFLPGCAFGATMAMPAVHRSEVGGAIVMLAASAGIAILSLVLEDRGWGFLGLLAFGAGVGAGYAEEPKHARELDRPATDPHSTDPHSTERGRRVVHAAGAIGRPPDE